MTTPATPLATPPEGGFVGRTAAESTPWWPTLPAPAPGTPNVVVVLLDDTGFAHFGCYGSGIDTPNIDRLAAGGLRYTNFHTTALCSPTRAALLTGRNHHSVGMRALSNFDTGFPNMRGCITPEAATVAEVLQPAGFTTLMAGKWHLAPMSHCSGAGPFMHWPLQRGFDRFYGFLEGETDQFHPELVHDNHYIDPPATAEEGYHLSEDLVDQATRMVRDTKSSVPEKPFFLYLAFGATHSPHQAPADYLQKYRGRFDEGWDVWRERVYNKQLELGIIPPGTELAPRNPGVKPWDALTVNEKAFACRLQEAFAAFLDHTDAQIGRLVAELERIGELDNTVLMLFSDNGASQEGFATGVFDEFRFFNGIPEDVDEAVKRLDDIGGPDSHCNYPWGWAQVGNTPNKRYKQNTHGGGVRDPLIVHWPAGIDPASNGAIRTQFHHVVDLTPTILDIVGVPLPATVKGVPQKPIEGTSLAYTFATSAGAAPTTKRTQYFEMFGHRGLWHEGWKAVAFHRPGDDYERDPWELYHLDDDFSECKDLAAERPDKLREMVERWWIEAGRYGVLPIDDRNAGLFAGHPMPNTPKGRERFVYFPPMSRLNPQVVPSFGARSWELTATVDRPKGRGNGVLLAVGTANNGLVLYVDGDRLVYDHNYFSAHTVVTSVAPVPSGRSTLAARFERVKRGPARVTLSIDGVEAGVGLVPNVAVMISSIGMDVGRNPTSVSHAYAAPFEFDGTIERLEVVVLPPIDAEDARATAIAELRAAQGIQ